MLRDELKTLVIVIVVILKLRLDSAVFSPGLSEQIVAHQRDGTCHISSLRVRFVNTTSDGITRCQFDVNKGASRA